MAITVANNTLLRAFWCFCCGVGMRPRICFGLRFAFRDGGKVGVVAPAG
jgi:hypothetical protein